MNKTLLQNQIKDYVIDNLLNKVIYLTKMNNNLIEEKELLKYSLISCLKQIFLIKQNFNISIPLNKLFKQNENLKNKIINEVQDSTPKKINNITRNIKSNSFKRKLGNLTDRNYINNKDSNIIVNVNHSRERKNNSRSFKKDDYPNNNLLNINSSSPTNATINLNFNKISINLNNESNLKRREKKYNNFIPFKTYQSKFPSQKDNTFNNIYHKRTLDISSNYSDVNFNLIKTDKSKFNNNDYKKNQKQKSNNRSMPKLPLEQIFGKNNFV